MVRLNDDTPQQTRRPSWNSQFSVQFDQNVFIIKKFTQKSLKISEDLQSSFF